MKLNLATVLSLLVALGGLLAAYMTGFLKSHPDVTAVLIAIEQILSAWLPKIASKDQ